MMMLTLGTWFVGAVLLAVLWTAYEAVQELIGIRAALDLRNHVAPDTNFAYGSEAEAKMYEHDVQRDREFAVREQERYNRELQAYAPKPKAPSFKNWEDRPVSFAPVRVQPEPDPIVLLNELAAREPYRFGSKPIDPVDAAKVQYDHVLWPETTNYNDAYPRTLYGSVGG